MSLTLPSCMSCSHCSQVWNILLPCTVVRVTDLKIRLGRGSSIWTVALGSPIITILAPFLNNLKQELTTGGAPVASTSLNISVRPRRLPRSHLATPQLSVSRIISCSRSTLLVSMVTSSQDIFIVLASSSRPVLKSARMTVVLPSKTDVSSHRKERQTDQQLPRTERRADRWAPPR